MNFFQILNPITEKYRNGGGGGGGDDGGGGDVGGC